MFDLYPFEIFKGIKQKLNDFNNYYLKVLLYKWLVVALLITSCFGVDKKNGLPGYGDNCHSVFLQLAVITECAILFEVLQYSYSKDCLAFVQLGTTVWGFLVLLTLGIDIFKVFIK